MAGSWGLRDRRNRVFPLRCDSESRTYIANAVETCLIDHLPRIVGMGIDAVADRCAGRGARYAGDMARLYLTGIEAVGRGDQGMLDVLKNEVKRAGAWRYHRRAFSFRGLAP